MSAHDPAAAEETPLRPAAPLAVEPARAAAAAVLGLLGFAAAVLLWRRVAGGLSTPLPAHILAAVAILAASAAAAAGRLWRSPAGMRPIAAAREASSEVRPRQRRWDLSPSSFGWAAAAGLAVLGAALSLPGTSAAGLALLWGILISGALAGHWPRSRRGAPTPPPASPPWRRAPEGVRYDPPQAPQPVLASFLPEAVSPEDVVQQLTRSHAADGGEVLAGWLRVDLASGQRSASLHVAFCPPFSQTPQLAVEQLGGPAARIRTVQTLPYGVRFDLKLEQAPAAAASVLLQFAARSKPSAEPGETGGE